MSCNGCTECGDCCRILDLMPTEFLEDNGLEHVNGVCLNLKDNKCLIYNERPEVCIVKEWDSFTERCCEAIQNVVTSKNKL